MPVQVRFTAVSFLPFKSLEMASYTKIGAVMSEEIQRAEPTNASSAYREPLPERCPPADSYEIVTDIAVYRLVVKPPPCDDDFRSQRAEKPHAKFSVEECYARGVSVFANLRAAEKAMKLPVLKDKIICMVRLSKGAGHIKPTFRPGHRTWWPFATYDILCRCEVMS